MVFSDSIQSNTKAICYQRSQSNVPNYDNAVLNIETSEPQFDDLRAILLDEKSVLRNHHYCTVMLNTDDSEPLHMDDDKKKESLDVSMNKCMKNIQSSVQKGGDRWR